MLHSYQSASSSTGQKESEPLSPQSGNFSNAFFTTEAGHKVEKEQEKDALSLLLDKAHSHDAIEIIPTGAHDF